MLGLGLEEVFVLTVRVRTGIEQLGLGLGFGFRFGLGYGPRLFEVTAHPQYAHPDDHVAGEQHVSHHVEIVDNLCG